MDTYAALKEYFGHAQFRPGQERLIDAILSGRDVLGVMPTGGGKSICYQIPALLLPGLTLVISPLISLMKDQVSALRGNGIQAAFLNSSLSSEDFQETVREIHRGAYKLVYIAPERLDDPRFSALLRDHAVSLLAVDEAHCISQWGHDFRPSYLKIADLADKLPRRPVVAAFTATATREVREDITTRLRLRDPVCLVTGFDRPNLYFEVRRPANKTAATLKLVRERRGKSGIIYCATRASVERVCQRLQQAGIPATRYHAGLSDQERRANQTEFQYDRRPVMVATNAFGMGIDKSNVNYVLHYNMPKSLEAYYQEAGRAGRDGEPAECILLFSQGDVNTAKYLIANSGENEALTEEERELVRRRDLLLLDAMVGFCKTSGCLRRYLLDYFGQTSMERCENCGNCRTPFVETDVTREAQMILSCVRRVWDRLGYYVGPALIIRVLRGSKDQRVRELGLDELSTYGLMRALPRGTVREIVDHLQREGFLTVEPEHGTLRPTPRANEVLFHGQRVTMLRPVEAPEDGVEGKRRAGPEDEAEGKHPAVQAGPDEGLLVALKALRGRLAREAGVPAYLVFSNAALADMAAKRPRTPEEFLEVSGVGQVKASQYGETFLREITAYLDETERDEVEGKHRVEPENPEDEAQGKHQADPGDEAEGKRRADSASPDEGLLVALKALRSRLAREAGVPAYIVFSNAALADMAAKRPRTPEEFLEVSGVGQVKAAQYGETFLREIASYLDGAEGDA